MVGVVVEELFGGCVVDVFCGDIVIGIVVGGCIGIGLLIVGGMVVCGVFGDDLVECVVCFVGIEGDCGVVCVCGGYEVV